MSSVTGQAGIAKSMRHPGKHHLLKPPSWKVQRHKSEYNARRLRMQQHEYATRRSRKIQDIGASCCSAPSTSTYAATNVVCHAGHSGLLAPLQCVHVPSMSNTPLLILMISTEILLLSPSSSS